MQAALASLPLEAVSKAYPPGSPNYAQYHQWATDALTVAVFEVIISGTLGCLLVRWLSPLLLTQVGAVGCHEYPRIGCPAHKRLCEVYIRVCLPFRRRLRGPWARRLPANTGCESMRSELRPFAMPQFA